MKKKLLRSSWLAPLACAFVIAMGGLFLPMNTVEASSSDPSTVTYLQGDLLINDSNGENTEHDAVYNKTIGESFSMVGKVNVTPIKGQIAAEMTKFGFNEASPELNAIMLSNLQSGFVAVLTVPEGVGVKADWTAQLDNPISGSGEPLFKIVSKEYSNGTITIAMELNNKDKYTTFKTLYDDVKNVADDLKVTVSGLYLKPTAEPDQAYAMVGTVDGSFQADATLGLYSDRFYYTWRAVQSESGRDATLLEGDQTIKLTMKAVKPAVASFPSVPGTLFGDLLADDNTESKLPVPVYEPGDTFKLTGKLNVTPIGKQIDALKAAFEAKHPGESDNISLSNVDSHFNAVLTLPEGLTPDKATVEFTDASGLFVKGTPAYDAETHKLTVPMNLNKKEQYTNFKTLYENVKAAVAKSPLTVDVDVKVADGQADGQLQMTGEVTGTFTGHAAYYNADNYDFDLSWSAVQEEGGKDVTLAAEDKAIALTIEVKKPVVVDPEPEEPKTVETTVKEHFDLDTDMSYTTEDNEEPIHIVKRGESFDIYVGVDLKPVTDFIKNYAETLKEYGKDDAAVENFNGTMTFTYTLPEGVSLKEDSEALAYGFGDGMLEFTETELSDDGRTATVSISVKLKEGVDTYKELVELLNSEDEFLHGLLIKVSDVVLSSDAQADKVYTTSVTVDGALNMDFVTEGHKDMYRLTMTGVQSEEGRDAALADGDNRITMSVKDGQKTTPAVTSGEKPAAAAVIKPAASPKTGDDSMIILWAVLVIAALGTTAAVAVARRKR